jgi:hypothetical protein
MPTRSRPQPDAMSGLQPLGDRAEIEALRGGFTSAVMMHDYDRLASLFTHDRAVRIPHINAEGVSLNEIATGIERLLGWPIGTAGELCALARVNISSNREPDRSWGDDFPNVVVISPPPDGSGSAWGRLPGPLR